MTQRTRLLKHLVQTNSFVLCSTLPRRSQQLARQMPGKPMADVLTSSQLSCRSPSANLLSSKQHRYQ